MYTTAIATATPGATKATPNPTYYTHTHPIERGGASSPKGHGQESSHVLLLCLRGIVAFFWAASRRTLERMFLAYLQSTINPTLRFLIANLTAITRRGGGGGGVRTCASAVEEAQALNDKEGAVTYQAGGACVNSKKVSWTYMRGAFSRLYPLFNDRLIERGGENAAICRCLPCSERTLPRLPLRRWAHSPLCHLGPQYVSKFYYYMCYVRAQQLPSETAPKRVRSAGTPCGKRRS
jgi:hypothetical protein